jgi:hypothetical protein
MTHLMIRAALQDDLEILWDFLAIAAYEPDATVAKAYQVSPSTSPSGAVPVISGWSRSRMAR